MTDRRFKTQGGRQEVRERKLCNIACWFREQYENAWKQLQDVRNNVERLRKEHIRLTDEASNIRLETHEYMNYMEKKTSKRQTMIVSLNDQNQKEIDKIKVALMAWEQANTRVVVAWPKNSNKAGKQIQNCYELTLRRNFRRLRKWRRNSEFMSFFFQIPSSNEW